MNKIISLITFALVTGTLFAQTERADYQLSESTTYEKQEAADDAIITLNEDYSMEFKYESEVAKSYTLLHKRVQLITDKGVNGYNAVYIPVNDGDSLLSYDARVITPAGKVISLGENALKEGYDERSKRAYKYFAFEGVEKGSDIEYFYYIKRNARRTLMGRVVNFQKSSLIKESTFEVITPDNIELGFKSYNDLGSVIRDTTLEEKNRWYLNKSNIAKFKPQSNAYDQPNQQYLIFKLEANTITGVTSAISYESVSTILFTNAFADASKDVTKKLKKILKELPVKGKTDEEIIRIVEHYVKSTFSFMDVANPQLENLESVLENKSLNEDGAVKLIGSLLSILEINCQLVLTNDRSEVPFDETFESYIFLSHRLFYFSKLGLYMEPFSPLSRLGYIDPMYMNTYALFITAKVEKKSLLITQKIGFIEPLKADRTTSDIYVDVTFDDAFENPNYHFQHKQTGYYANTYQCGYDFIKEEEKLKVWSELAIRFLDEEGVIKNLEIKNKGCEHFGVKPYIAEADFKSDKFLDFAGNKYLFKIGDLIGPQMELYQEEERVLPVQSDYNRKYHREINFNIPEGYKVANLEDIKIEKTHKNDEGTVDMTFQSLYEVKGNMVTVKIDEYYHTMDYTKEEFANYQKVINAAADFNKVVLIIQQN